MFYLAEKDDDLQKIPLIKFFKNLII